MLATEGNLDWPAPAPGAKWANCCAATGCPRRRARAA